MKRTSKVMAIVKIPHEVLDTEDRAAVNLLAEDVAWLVRKTIQDLWTEAKEKNLKPSDVLAEKWALDGPLEPVIVDQTESVRVGITKGE